MLLLLASETVLWGGYRHFFGLTSFHPVAMIDLTYVHNYRILAEYASRPFVVGTKNWLFCDNVKGAESSAIVYSLVEIAKASGIDPYQYLHLVLTMLPNLVNP